MICIGHRGAKGHAPENTVISVQKALELGVQCIEVDVYFVDGHFIVFHDNRLERTTNGEGTINRNIVEQVHSHQFRILGFTANLQEDILRMKDIGVDGLFSDYPERVLSAQIKNQGMIGWN